MVLTTITSRKYSIAYKHCALGVACPFRNQAFSGKLRAVERRLLLALGFRNESPAVVGVLAVRHRDSSKEDEFGLCYDSSTCTDRNQ